MLIEKDRVAAIAYTLIDAADNNVLETIESDEPLTYLHGHDNIAIGLETALTHRQKGDRLAVTVSPADGYGEYETDGVLTMEAEMFEEAPEVGEEIVMEIDAGVFPVRVIAVNEKEVVLDANHPLAGKTLLFHVEVLDVRPATDDELAHGHPHDDDGGCPEDHDHDHDHDHD